MKVFIGQTVWSDGVSGQTLVRSRGENVFMEIHDQWGSDWSGTLQRSGSALSGLVKSGGIYVVQVVATLSEREDGSLLISGTWRETNNVEKNKNYTFTTTLIHTRGD